MDIVIYVGGKCHDYSLSHDFPLEVSLKILKLADYNYYSFSEVSSDYLKDN